VSRPVRARGSGPLLLLLIAGLVTAAGCVPGYVRVSLKARPDTNSGKPVYFLVRAAERKVFTAESYADVAARLDAPDATVLRARMLTPGAKESFYIKKPDKASLGVFVLFTAPGGSWFTLLDPPLPYRVSLELSGNQIRKESR
jgi:hypothetical protein